MNYDTINKNTKITHHFNCNREKNKSPLLHWPLKPDIVVFKDRLNRPGRTKPPPQFVSHRGAARLKVKSGNRHSKDIANRSMNCLADLPSPASLVKCQNRHSANNNNENNNNRGRKRRGLTLSTIPTMCSRASSTPASQFLNLLLLHHHHHRITTTTTRRTVLLLLRPRFTINHSCIRARQWPSVRKLNSSVGPVLGVVQIRTP